MVVSFAQRKNSLRLRALGPPRCETSSVLLRLTSTPRVALDQIWVMLHVPPRKAASLSHRHLLHPRVVLCEHCPPVNVKPPLGHAISWSCVFRNPAVIHFTGLRVYVLQQLGVVGRFWIDLWHIRQAPRVVVAVEPIEQECYSREKLCPWLEASMFGGSHGFEFARIVICDYRNAAASLVQLHKNSESQAVNKLERLALPELEPIAKKPTSQNACDNPTCLSPHALLCPVLLHWALHGRELGLR